VVASANMSLRGIAAVRRVTTILALALCLSGCSSAASSGSSASSGSGAPLGSAQPSDSALPPGEPVELHTGADGCYLTMFPIWGRLLPDPVYGTSLDGVPIIWPTGSTGVRLAGGGVEVRVPHAGVGESEFVATTGKDYWLGNGLSRSKTVESAIAFAACAVADADPERLKGGGISMAAGRASDWLKGKKEELVLTNIRYVWCAYAPLPKWCQWVRGEHGGPVASKIEDANLTVGVRMGTPVALAEELCRDVAADDNVLPEGWVWLPRNKTMGVYSHVDVEAGPDQLAYTPIGMDWFTDGVRLADCFVP
jgi:hypothetical protein